MVKLKNLILAVTILLLVACNSSTAKTQSNNMAVTDNTPAEHLYVFASPNNSESGTIFIYNLDIASGVLTLQSTITQDYLPAKATIGAMGNLMYVLSYFGPILEYGIEPDSGLLVLLASQGPLHTQIGQDIVTDPSGQYVYIVNPGVNAVIVYNINQTTGILTPESTITTNLSNMHIMIPTPGEYAYITNGEDNSISSYSINNGILMPTYPQTVEVAASANLITSANLPSGQYVYTTSETSNPTTISMYSINQATGVLDPLTPQIITTDSSLNTIALVVDPSQSHLYLLLDDFTILLYNINQTDGTLTLAGPAITSSIKTSDSHIAINRSGSNTSTGSDNFMIDPSGLYAIVCGSTGSGDTGIINIYQIESGSGLLTLASKTLLPPNYAVSSGIIAKTWGSGAISQ